MRSDRSATEIQRRSHPRYPSFGVVERTPEDKDLPTLLIRADTSLYIAKNSGRNRVVCTNVIAEVENTSHA